MDRSTYRPWLRVNKNTISKELSNVPRLDLDKRRYGNTLTDDMIAIKNPRGITQHTPVSYDYLNDKDNWVEDHTIPPDFVTFLDLDHNTWQDVHENQTPTVSPGAARLSRKKFVTDEVSVPHSRDNERESIYQTGAEEELMGLYTKALLDRKALKDLQGMVSTGGSIIDDTRYLKTGGRTYHEKGEQMPRWDAEWDPAVNENVNYNLLSPREIEQLYKMGVNRPESENLMGILKSYDYYVKNHR